MSQKRARSASPAESGAGVYRSGVIEDRSSTFKAAFSATASQDDLCALPEFKGASHRIAAWRRPSKQRSLVGNKPLFVSGHDDDGEQYAGKKLEDLLRDSGVQGTMVVARWYGGILLGPVRFTHILDCAKQAVRGWEVAEADRRKRQRRLEEETQPKPQLTATLKQRDESISVLRGLLAEKLAPEGQPKASPATVKTAPDYDAIEYETLKRLEKARDATIAFILAQIEKAEAS